MTIKVMTIKTNYILRRARLAFIAMIMTGCASLSHSAGFDAYGYLSPNPAADGERIGNFSTRTECEAAGAAWMSQQTVGNRVRAECFPVDRR